MRLSWIDRGSRYPAGRGLSAGDAREVTLALLTVVEGTLHESGFLLARGLHSVEPLLAAGSPISCDVSTLRADIPIFPDEFPRGDAFATFRVISNTGLFHRKMTRHRAQANFSAVWQ